MIQDVESILENNASEFPNLIESTLIVGDDNQTAPVAKWWLGKAKQYFERGSYLDYCDAFDNARSSQDAAKLTQEKIITSRIKNISDKISEIKKEERGVSYKIRDQLSSKSIGTAISGSLLLSSLVAVYFLYDSYITNPYYIELTFSALILLVPILFTISYFILMPISERFLSLSFRRKEQVLRDQLKSKENVLEDYLLFYSNKRDESK